MIDTGAFIKETSCKKHVMMVREEVGDEGEGLLPFPCIGGDVCFDFLVGGLETAVSSAFPPFLDAFFTGGWKSTPQLMSPQWVRDSIENDLTFSPFVTGAAVLVDINK